jgi:beta-xylosidase
LFGAVEMLSSLFWTLLLTFAINVASLPFAPGQPVNQPLPAPTTPKDGSNLAITPIIAPSVPMDFPDPAILKLDDGWYSFGTSSRGRNVQVAKSADFKKWDLIERDAMPQLPAWVNAKIPLVWAPDVAKLDNGDYILYFSATTVATQGIHHCVGAATAKDISGPYTALPNPLVCPNPDGKGTDVKAMIPSSGSGGAIDPSAFTDTNGDRYLIYKVDGNSLSPGGACGNPGEKKMATPLMAVRVAGDGVTPLAAPVVLMDRIERDGPLIEAPDMARLADGTYILLFSSNCWNSPYYDVSWATSKSVLGPYTRATDSMLKTGTGGLTAPGGASISSDGVHMVFHANHEGGRAMYSTTLGGTANNLKMKFLE